MSYEDNYFKLIKDVLETGEIRPSRVGDTIAVFGAQLRVPDLMYGAFPLLTTRRMMVNGQLGELAAFVRGASDLATFKKFGCNFWDANAAKWPVNADKSVEEHQVGRIYGVQWREWNGCYDQLMHLVNGIQADPYGRRHLLSTWNPSELQEMALPPCHILAQYFVNTNGHLDCHVYMRSVDVCLCLPSDVVLYAALLCLVAKETSLKPGVLIFSFGDTHIYTGHIPQVHEQLKRWPGLGPSYDLAPDARLLSFQPEDFQFHDYTPYERINYALYV